MARAPAYTSSGHSRTAAVGHITAARGRGLLYIGRIIRCHGRHSDEIGDIGRVLRHVETDGCTSTYGRAVSGPVVEAVIAGCCGCKITCFALVIGAATTYRAAVGRVGRGGNGILWVLGEICGVCGTFRYLESVC